MTKQELTFIEKVNKINQLIEKLNMKKHGSYECLFMDAETDKIKGVNNGSVADLLTLADTLLENAAEVVPNMDKYDLARMIIGQE